MKICVLRRDGKEICNGMVAMVQIISEAFFGERELFIEKNEKDFTEMLTFEIEDNKEIESEVLPFIMEVSRINPLYAVRLYS